MKILVTGAAGFIGAFLCKRILNTADNKVVGIDNLNDYYDVSLKEERLKMLSHFENFSFIKGDIADKDFIEKLFKEENFDLVINLAAQAGVRYSIDHPDVYIESNIIGFYNILEACRHNLIKHLIYASSSSVYGENDKIPFSTNDNVDKPVSLYAATKKSDELLAYAYSKLYDIPTTGLRFFTVYGPMGRPDMAYFNFAKKLINGDTIEIFNYGNCKRDFTFIDDIVEGIMKVLKKVPTNVNDSGEHIAPYKIYNIGNNKPESLLEFVKILSEELVKANVLPDNFDFESHKKLVPMQKGDVSITYADISDLERDFGYKPSTTLRDGLRKFSEWFFEYYIKGAERKWK